MQNKDITLLARILERVVFQPGFVTRPDGSLELLGADICTICSTQFGQAHQPGCPVVELICHSDAERDEAHGTK